LLKEMPVVAVKLTNTTQKLRLLIVLTTVDAMWWRDVFVMQTTKFRAGASPA